MPNIQDMFNQSMKNPNATTPNFADYDYVKQQMDASGLFFSDADRWLATVNPQAAMGILEAKKRYTSATTAEERAKANQDAERIRSQFGQYSGGKTGSGFSPQYSPGGFQMDPAPSFSYSLENDPVYDAYRKQYTREGQRATQDTLGAMAAASGGMPSTYATTAASQAGDYYAAQLSDKVPELYQQAYNRYLNELNQWNTDRSFKYGQYIDEYNSQQSEAAQKLQNALYQAQFGDYSGLADMGYDVSNIPAEFEKKYDLATLAASLGDNSFLQNWFGIKPNQGTVNADMQYNLAMALAQLGDTSKLYELIGKYFK
jgi:hypothetical protein